MNTERNFSKPLEGPVIDIPPSRYAPALEQWQEIADNTHDNERAYPHPEPYPHSHPLSEVDPEQERVFIEYINRYQLPTVLARWRVGGVGKRPERELKLTHVMWHYNGYAKTALPQTLTHDDVHELLSEYDIPLDIPTSLTYGVDEDGWVGFDLGHAWDVCLDTDGVPLSVKSGRALMATSWGESTREWTPEMAMSMCEQLAISMTELEHKGRYNE